MKERPLDEGRRHVMLENDSIDVAIGLRDTNGKFIPLSIGPTSSGLSLNMVLEEIDRRVVDPITIPAAEAAVWTPALGAGRYLDFEFEVINEDGTTDVTQVDVGIDIGTTGATNRYLLKDVTLPEGGVGIRKGPYRIGGDDSLRANAVAVLQAVLYIYIIREGDAI